jgi:hypothetical protein
MTQFMNLSNLVTVTLVVLQFYVEVTDFTVSSWNAIQRADDTTHETQLRT